MKQLSIEEKAKAYDKALEIMKAYYNRTQFSSISDSKEELKTIEKAFPELKESEDERIRKELIEQVIYIVPDKNEVDDNGNTLPCYTTRIDKYIAWLEKQADKYDKIVEKAKSEKQRVLITETNGNAGIDWDTRSIADTKMLLEYGLDFINKKLENHDGQNPAWSEEDEQYVKDTLALLSFGCSIHGITQVQDWLKSLKERYTWKPTEEQMKALNYVVNLMASSASPTENDYYYNVFKDLRKQLKKLMEE